MAKFDDVLDLRGFNRQDNHRRHDAEIREPVAFIGAEFLGRCEHIASADDLLKIAKKVSVRVRLRVQRRNCYL